MQITADKVAEVIILARDSDRSRAEFASFVGNLTQEEQAELVAIMWIGRGSFEPEDLREAIDTARNEATTPCADYLIGTPHLSDNLENGLEALGISATDAEDELM